MIKPYVVRPKLGQLIKAAEHIAAFQLAVVIGEVGLLASLRPKRCMDEVIESYLDKLEKSGDDLKLSIDHHAAKLVVAARRNPLRALHAHQDHQCGELCGNHGLDCPKIDATLCRWALERHGELVAPLLKAA